MRLVTFAIKDLPFEETRLGAILDAEKIVDLTLGYATYLREVVGEPRPYELAAIRIPPSTVHFLEGGQQSLEAAGETLSFIREAVQEGRTPGGPGGRGIVYSLREVKLKAPLPRPGKIIAANANFADHVAESRNQPSERSFPTAFIKVSSAVIGPGEPVVYPRTTRQLDYEVELAVIIGKRGKDIPLQRAYEYVAGYTIFNDISARDIQIGEMEYRVLALGKNLDTLAPMGPYLVLKDEVEDPENLDMELRVNGEVRQKSNTKHMIFSIPRLIEYWSQMTLEPGDIITSGTPAGIAFARQPDPTPWLLKPGDVVEAEIEGLGVLRNPVVSS